MEVPWQSEHLYVVPAAAEKDYLPSASEGARRVACL